jgi:hypothetical protein
MKKTHFHIFIDMKWTKQNDNTLKELIEEGKTHEEISIIFGVSKKTINNRCFRLKLKSQLPSKSHKQSCKYCGDEFVSYISDERFFCSLNCSASYNNLQRNVLTEDVKNKISQSLKKYHEPKQEKNRKEITDDRGEKQCKLIKEKNRKCRSCGVEKKIPKYKITCDDCRYQYYKFYRPSCEFDFDFKTFEAEFNTTDLKKLGWYSPSNKGNNLNGVSKDHMYSVKEGFINKIDPEIIKHPANCQLLKYSENSIKKTSCSITIDELISRIKEWNDKFNKDNSSNSDLNFF